MTVKTLRLIAHRGASAVAPENTLAALQQAHQLGANWLEVDVQCTTDGVPWLIHDFTLERTSSGSGLATAKAWSEIADLDCGSWFASAFAGEKPLSFAASLQYVLSKRLNIIYELKVDEQQSRSAQEHLFIAISNVLQEQNLVHATELPVTIMFSSSSLAMLEWVASASWSFPLAYILDQWDEQAVVTAKKLGCQELHCNAAMLNPQLVKQLQALGFAVLAYTVNDASQASALAAMGVDGVFTDKLK